jgi:mercuric reductase
MRTESPTFRLRPGVAFPDWSTVSSDAAREAVLALLELSDMGHRWGTYTDLEDRVRSAILRHFADRGHSPFVAALARATDLQSVEVERVVESLVARDLVVREDGRIAGAYPFTERETEHRVTITGHVVHAMCAIDALGTGAMLGRDVDIDSRCRACGAAIRVATRDRGRTLAAVSPADTVVWSGIRYEGGCAASSICTAMAFFCSDAHLRAWLDARDPTAPGFRLSIGEALEVGRAIFGPALARAER